MARLFCGFKLFQPWANDVINGNLNYLVRSIPTAKRERVAVIATKGIDSIWALNATDIQINEIQGKFGAIGSVLIKECITIKLKDMERELIKIGGEQYWNYYPKHMIPRYTRTGEVYIWILNEIKKWKNPKEVSGGGITWAKVNLEDR